MEKSYIHYGMTEFLEENFQPIKNSLMLPIKPEGGLWASPIDAERGWKDWCEDESFHLSSLESSFMFQLSPDAKILRIASKEDIPDRYVITQIVDPYGMTGFMDWIYLDFEKILWDGYDGVEILAGSDWELYHAFYGWDCDSIVIMNPNVVRPL